MAARRLLRVPSLRAVDVGALVRDQKLHEGWDDETDSYILDEDQLCDALEERMEAGGVVVDYHGADLFPERWFDLVVVLRTDNDVLYPRLEGRQYAPKKITENVEAEIMQVILPTAPGVSNEGRSSPLLALAPLFLGPEFQLGARWNRLVEAVKTRKKREKTGKRWARYSLKRVKVGS